MPQIGWFELLLIVVVAILVIGPKDFPIVLKKIGSWMGTIKRYFYDVQKNITEINTRLSSAEATWQMAENLYRQLADQVREHSYDIKDLNREINY